MLPTSGFPQQGATLSSVATAALALQQHIFGSRSNEYDQGDPFMQAVIGYWAHSCPGSGPGGICALAQSGNLQCVEFVTAAYWLGGDPLPAAPNAQDFWTVYQHEAGWQAIPSPTPQAPALGDLIVFAGGAHLEEGSMVEYGHIGIVVGFDAPSATRNGSIEVAQSNGPGTKWSPLSTNPWVASDRPGNTYIMTVHPDYRIETWGPYTLNGVSYGGMRVLGFLRHLSLATSNPPLSAHASQPRGQQSLHSICSPSISLPAFISRRKNDL
jgi:hypothetical protein